MKQVTEIQAITVQLDCPYCGALQEGWVCDPRGVVEKCEECGEEYKVHPDADIDIW